MFYLPTFTSHIFKSNVCKYTIHGTYGISECPQFVPPYIYLGIFDMAHEGMGNIPYTSRDGEFTWSRTQRLESWPPTLGHKKVTNRLVKVWSTWRIITVSFSGLFSKVFCKGLILLEVTPSTTYLRVRGMILQGVFFRWVFSSKVNGHDWQFTGFFPSVKLKSQFLSHTSHTNFDRFYRIQCISCLPTWKVTKWPHEHGEMAW